MTIPYPRSPLRWLHPYDVASATDAYRTWTRAQCARWGISHATLQHCERHLQLLNAIANATERTRSFVSIHAHLAELAGAVMHNSSNRSDDLMPVPAVFHAAGEIAFRWSEACACVPAFGDHLEKSDVNILDLPRIACQSFEITFGLLEALHDSLGDPTAWWSEDAERRSLSWGISIIQQDVVTRLLHASQIIMSIEVASRAEEWCIETPERMDISTSHIYIYRIVQTHLDTRTIGLIRAVLERAARFCHLAFRDRMSAYRFGAVAAAIAFFLGEWDAARGYTDATPALTDMESDEHMMLQSDIERVAAIQSLCATLQR